MNTTHHKRGPQNRHPHMKRLLTALFVAAMVLILTVPAFAAEATATESAPDTEVSTWTPDLTETPADEDDAFPNEADPTPVPSSGPVTTFEELQDAIAHANENDVIEVAGEIHTPSELVLGRADCPVTIRRTSDHVCLILGSALEGSIKVQNITFDGAGHQATAPFVLVDSPTQIFEKCNFVNYVGSCALFITNGDTVVISDCHFSNNIGYMGAHLYTGARKVTIENCTFTGGRANDYGSVLIAPREEAFMIGCTVSGNSAGNRGGGIYVSGMLTITGSKIYGNTTNGIADDITLSESGHLFLTDDYATLVELYKPDGVTPNRWTVDSRMPPNGTARYHTEMVFSMTFADNESSPPPAPSPTSVTLDKSELTLDVGETDTLTATLYPEGTNSNIQWTSSDPTVASVTESGFITANSTGTALITATAAVGRASASCRVNVQAVPVTTYSISINASPVDGGTVSGGGQYEDGATVTVTAVPNEDFRFLAWTEADTQISTEASLTFTVNSDRTLIAIFEPISEPTPGPIPKSTYTINTSATEGGTVSGAGEYEQGSSVILTATPESGYLFVGWTENDEQISTEESFTIIVDRDRTLAANFAPTTQPTYTINVSATAGGTASGGGKYEQGSSVTLAATPESGYFFVGWTENNEQISTEESFTFTADRDRTLVANFAPITQPTYTINTSATEGGTASGGGKYAKGSSVTLTATPESEYLFIGWTENGEQVSTDESFTFIVEQDRTLVANFEPIPQTIYTVQVTSTQGGTAEGGGSYEKGTFITVNAVPDNGYRFLYWEENGEQVSPVANVSFMVIRNRTLVANFEPIPKPVYTIQVNSTQGGVVDGGGSYTKGESVTVTATSDTGYRFLRWEENGVQVSTEARFSFTAEADRTLVAVFALIPQSTPNWTPTISYVPKGGNVKPVVTSMSVKEEVKKPTLTNGKAALTAPDDLFWGGYKAGRANGAGTVTRADLAQLIYSMIDDESKKIYGVTHPPFRDVESGAWYETAVGAMLDAGVMFGCGNNQFCPDRTLTWGELLTVFARFTEDKPLTEYYTGEHWAKDSVNKAFTLGWLKYSEGFDPGRMVTTGEMVNLIQAVFQWNNE